MKHLPKLFIETTVFNFYLEGKHGKKQKDAMRLFDEIAKGRYKAYTSEAVLREIKAAPEEKRRGKAQKNIKPLQAIYKRDNRHIA